jgi:DNA-binding LacI/PurR family transcriptional regulator
LSDQGLKIPADVSVVGVNDTLEARVLNPPLTSVRVFTEQLGKQMAELLLRAISQLELNPQIVTLPTQLVRRESCRPLMQTEQGARKDEAPAS